MKKLLITLFILAMFRIYVGAQSNGVQISNNTSFLINTGGDTLPKPLNVWYPNCRYQPASNTCTIYFDPRMNGKSLERTFIGSLSETDWVYTYFPPNGNMSTIGDTVKAYWISKGFKAVKF